jgi:hypothetical protein
MHAAWPTVRAALQPLSEIPFAVLMTHLTRRLDPDVTTLSSFTVTS